MGTPRQPETNAFPYLPRFSSKRPFLFVAAFFIAGILAGERVWHGGLPLTAAVVVVVILAALQAAVASTRFGIVVAAALVAWVGIVTVNCYRARVARRDSFTALVGPGEERRIEGIVLDEPQGERLEGGLGRRGYWRYRFLVRVTGVESDEREIQPANGKAVVSVAREGELGLDYGDRVLLWGNVTAPDPARNPGGFDYRAYLDHKGIRRVIRVGMPDEAERLGGGGSVVWKLVYAARDGMERALDTGRMREDNRAFLKAVLLGKRRGVGEALEDALVDTNTVHILAISGLHVAIIAVVIRRALRACFLPPWAASVLTLVVLAFYAAMTGFRAPVVRASVMMAVLLLGPIVRREAEPLNSLAFAAVVVLLVRPLELFSAGFQLSFIAVGSITMLAPRMIQWAAERLRLMAEPGVDVPGWRKTFNPLAFACVQLFAASVAVYIGVAPLTAYYFNRFAPLSFIPNVAVIGLMGLIVPLGLLSAVAGQVSSVISAGLNTMNNVLIGALSRVVVLTSNVRFLHLNVRSAPALVLAAYYALLMAVGFSARATRTMRVALAGALAVVGGAVLWSPVPPGPRGTEIVVLDVGKGESIFVRTPRGERILIDGGMVLGSDPGRWVIMPFLRSRGYNRLDTVVLTHYDADHYGGLAHVFGRIAVGRFVVRGGPESHRTRAVARIIGLVERRGIPVERLEAGDRLTRPGDTAITALAPRATLEETASENNASIVLSISEGPGALLAADIEAETERWLVETHAAELRASVLKVAHQGSRTSSTPAFLEAVGPELAIVTADRFKIHPHPAPEVVERYESRGTRVLRTDHHGAITVLLTDDGLRAWTMLRPEADPGAVGGR